MSVRPLKLITEGLWRSQDERWTFARHESDPEPKRWFAYDGDDTFPANEGLGHTTLREVVRFAEGWR